MSEPDEIPADPTLELSPEVMRALVCEAMDRIAAHIESLPSQPATNVSDAAALARSLVEPLPRTGTPFREILEKLFTEWIPASYNTASPGYLSR